MGRFIRKGPRIFSRGPGVLVGNPAISSREPAVSSRVPGISLMPGHKFWNFTNYLRIPMLKQNPRCWSNDGEDGFGVKMSGHFI